MRNCLTAVRTRRGVAATRRVSSLLHGRVGGRAVPSGDGCHLVQTQPPRIQAVAAFSTAKIDMAMLKDLRARSGAPIVECKRALQETSNDVPTAMDWLRRHGASKTLTKVQGRETTEGLVGLQISNGSGSAALVKVASETDFAAKSDAFCDLVSNVTEAVLLLSPDNASQPSQQELVDSQNGNDSLVRTATNEEGTSVGDLLDDAVVAIRENLSIAHAIHITSNDPSSILVGYIHNRVDGSSGSAAAIVQVAPVDGASISRETLESTGKKLAMHVVAARPRYLSPEDVPEDVVEKERDVLMEQLEDESSSKPPEILQKIVDGRMRKFYEGICLTEQQHMIEEGNPKVSKVLKEQTIVARQFATLEI